MRGKPVNVGGNRSLNTVAIEFRLWSSTVMGNTFGFDLTASARTGKTANNEITTAGPAKKNPHIQ